MNHLKDSARAAYLPAMFSLFLLLFGGIALMSGENILFGVVVR